MKTRRCSVRLTVMTLVALALAAAAEAQIHFSIPEESQPPFYAAFGQGFLPHTEDWAVVVFLRTPECVPTDFNLLDQFDAPPRPFFCDLQIEGRSSWQSLDDPYPAEVQYFGTGAVPVWFVSWPELQAAVADDELTITDLAALPSLLVGSASFFRESIRNDSRGERGGNEALIASGILADGRWFQVEITEKFRDGEHIFNHVRIEFR